MIRHYFWDFDGTLYDTYPPMAQAMVDALAKAGHRAPFDQVMALMKASMTHAYQVLGQRFGIDDAFLEGYLAMRYQKERAEAQPFPGVAEALSRLWAAGGKHYIVTHRGRSVAELLAKDSLLGLFTDMTTSEQAFARKPDPQAILYLLHKHCIPPEQAVMVGDRDLDIEAGRRAGLQTWFFDPDSDQVHPRADHTFRHFAQLWGLVP